jgi:hypothetical protein
LREAGRLCSIPSETASRGEVRLNSAGLEVPSPIRGRRLPGNPRSSEEKETSGCARGPGQRGGATVVTGGYVSPREAGEFSERRSGCEPNQLDLARTPTALSQTRERRPRDSLAVYPYTAYRYTKTPGDDPPGVFW